MFSLRSMNVVLLVVTATALLTSHGLRAGPTEDVPQALADAAKEMQDTAAAQVRKVHKQVAEHVIKIQQINDALLRAEAAATLVIHEQAQLVIALERGDEILAKIKPNVELAPLKDDLDQLLDPIRTRQSRLDAARAILDVRVGRLKKASQLIEELPANQRDALREMIQNKLQEFAPPVNGDAPAADDEVAREPMPADAPMEALSAQMGPQPTLPRAGLETIGHGAIQPTTSGVMLPGTAASGPGWSGYVGAQPVLPGGTVSSQPDSQHLRLLPSGLAHSSGAAMLHVDVPDGAMVTIFATVNNQNKEWVTQARNPSRYRHYHIKGLVGKGRQWVCVKVELLHDAPGCEQKLYQCSKGVWLMDGDNQNLRFEPGDFRKPCTKAPVPCMSCEKADAA